MPTPTIPDGELFMNATLWTGNGGTQTITNGVAGQAFQPDLIWIKSRSNAYNNFLTDSVRGASKYLISNSTDAEADAGSAGITAFNSNGFSMGSGTALNASGATYVGWQWKAGGAAVTNTAGSISSQVSANTTSGFSVVTYTGNGNNSNVTIGHGLGVIPAMVILKPRSAAVDWAVAHQSLGNSRLYLNLGNASASGFGGGGDLNYQNTFTSTTFNVQQGSSSNTNYNTNGGTYVAYCWSEIAGYSAFGSYTGNGSTDGPFIYTGFRPRFIMIKRTSGGTGSWAMYDTSRNTFNVSDKEIAANESASEYTRTEAYMDILSNGFKLRNTDNWHNVSGSGYIYMAVAENPFKYSLAR